MHRMGVSRDRGGDDLRDQAIMFCDLRRWTAPIEWSGVNVSACSASGLSARCLRVLAGDTQGSYAV